MAGRIRIAAALTCLCAATARAGEGILPDVLIQAEEKRPVSREKPPLIMNVKDDDPFKPLLDTDEDVRLRVPAEMARSMAFTPGAAVSSQVPLPSSHWIMPLGEMSARSFFPLRELTAVFPGAQSKGDRAKSHWRLVVVDAAGKVFRKFEGPGLPPERIDFDGRSDEGAWLREGQVYTAVLTYNDPSGRGHTAMGKPFALAGVSLRGQAENVIRLAPRAVLLRDSGAGAKISDSGARLLREAAHLVQRYYPGRALEVGAYLGRKDSSWVDSAAGTCARELARLLLAPAGSVTSKGHPGTSDLEERLEIRILNR